MMGIHRHNVRFDWKVAILALVAIVLACTSARAGEAPTCASGSKTRLELVRTSSPKIPRLDQSTGRERFVLRSLTDGKMLLSNDVEGQWFCFGFDANTRTYVVGGIAQVGAWLPLRSILYLKEDGKEFVPSAFDREDFLANTTVRSPSGRFIAFVGGKITTGQLYVLDTVKDRVRKLGPAPAPPPSSESEFISDEPFAWGTGWADGYVEMDPGIIRFEEDDVLKVSLGKDGPKGRAKKRWSRTYRLGS